jgi:ribonuclease BN (tRNA processing enzyme)
MPKFLLKSKINSLLKNTGKAPIVEINFLGTGGAFDLEEKNSSALIKTAAGTILIDCGSTVYTQLREKSLIESVDYVFITHCHEDHIGSLSTFIYHKYFIQKQTVKIECIPSLKPLLETYLIDICGHMPDSFIINSEESFLYEDLNMMAYKIETTGYHFKDYPSSGFVFKFRKSGEDFYVLYSGDINTPFINLIESMSPDLYTSLLKSSENVFIFHESTSRDYPPAFPHCKYDKLETIVDIFPNIYTYHHSQEDTKSILQDYRIAKMKIDSIKRAIDADLVKKLSLVKKYETQEALRIQAKKMKEEFEEEFFMPPLRVKDLNLIGKELVIQEEMGI